MNYIDIFNSNLISYRSYMKILVTAGITIFGAATAKL